jgi:2-amino-4-hydroxy-6-hydroxymethyldihydropteridine diphosphokinase
MLSDIYIAVGSNIEPQENIKDALIELKKYVEITAISNFYKTAPIGNPANEDFLNGVIKIKTGIKPRELKFDILRKVEEKLGRIHSTDKNAARTIDLDLILYDDLVIDEPDLRLPDPSIRLYPFIAIPLFELIPDLILPDTKTALTNEPIVKLKTGLKLESEFTEYLRRLIIV